MDLSRSLVFRLKPYIRTARLDRRGPWFIEERRIMDYLLVYIDQGSGFFSVNGHGFAVKAGDLIWLPPRAPHEMRGHPPAMRVLYIHFDLLYDKVRSAKARITTGGQRNLGPESRWVHPPTGDAQIDGWCGRLPVVNGAAIRGLIWQAAVEDQGARDPLLCAALMLQIVAEISRGLSTGATRAGVRWPALQRAAEDILRQPGAALDISALAHRAHLSVSHFRRLFREVHNKSPRQFYDAARAQKACEMILYTASSMTAIARELGFSTVHNFSRAFRRQVGVSPRAYKRRGVGTAAMQ